MSAPRPDFLPTRLRPAAAHRRRRSRLVTAALLPGLVALLPLWRVQAVDVDAAGALPPQAVATLESLRGASVLAVDLDDIRRRLEVVPGVAGVQVSLELPGTLHVTARPTSLCASVAVGRRWHGIDCSGALAGPIDGPRAPVLHGFSHDPNRIRQALAVADRLAGATGATVESITWVMPDDYRASLRFTRGGRPLQVLAQVQPRGSAAERYWCSRAVAADPDCSWVDLRSDRRLVRRVVNRSRPADPEGRADG